MARKMTVEQKCEKEKKVVGLMIGLYCKGNRHDVIHGDTLCPECLELQEYANFRASKCPFMETKTFCNNCKVHCYKPEYRQRIKEVMRYAGPRMLFHHPIMAIHHLILQIKEK